MKSYWYANGLHFECMRCGACCSGPAQGYIWVSRPEIQMIADFLEMSVGQFRRDYLRRVGLRATIIEHGVTRDCIFLQNTGSERKCVIYPVRPSQCRGWPFWPTNLTNPEAWNHAAQKCPGINRGRHYSCEEIERIKKKKTWWQSSK